MRRVLLNGKPYTKLYLTHADLMAGGTLEFIMAAKPDKKRGQAAADKPYSMTDINGN